MSHVIVDRQGWGHIHARMPPMVRQPFPTRNIWVFVACDLSGEVDQFWASFPLAPSQATGVTLLYRRSSEGFEPS